MSDYGITRKGVNIKRLDTIMDEMHTDLSTGWGINTRNNPKSFLNVLMTDFGDKIAELWEFGQQIYQSYHPSSAEDTALDDACQFAGVVREGAAKSVYPIHCTGVDGTVLDISTKISSDTNPSVDFTISANKKIERASCNSMVVRVVAVEQSTYTISINQTLYNYTGESGDEALDILNGLAAVINATDVFTADVAEGESYPIMTIAAIDETVNYAILLTENLTTEQVTSIINFQSVDFGDIVVPDGAISIITKGPSNFSSCVNKCGYVPGQDEETDTEFRQSYAAKVFNVSNRTLQSIRAGIMTNVDGVKTVAVYENDTDVTDSAGRPPHSVEVVVDGGDSVQIANQIWLRKAGGINTYGEVEVDIVGMNNETIAVHFNRPVYRYVWWRIVVYQDPESSLPSDYASQIAALVAGFMEDVNTGDDVIPQRAFKSIYAQVPGIAYMDVKLYVSPEGTSDAPVDDSDYEYLSVAFSDRERGTTTSSMVKVALDG